MANKEQQGLIDRFLQGWKQLIEGGEKVTPPANLKPFPKNKFYSPEELNFLSEEEKDNLSEIDRWALAMSKKGYDKSVKKEGVPFLPVQWADGRMSVYNNGNVYPDNTASQAEKLSLLKAAGYEMPDKYQQVIDNYDASKLVGKIFNLKDENAFMQIDSVKKTSDRSPELNILKWAQHEPESIHVDSIGYKDFQSLYGSKIYNLSSTEQAHLADVLNNIERGKSMFDQTVALIKNTNPTMFGDSFAIDEQRRFDTELSIGGLSLVPKAWELTNDNTIRLVYNEAQGDLRSSMDNETEITRNNAYKAIDIVSLINNNITEKNVKSRAHALVTAIGADWGEDKVYRYTSTIPFKEQSILSKNIVATKDGELNAFDPATHKQSALVGKDLIEVRDAVEIEAQERRTVLRDKVGIAEFGDFYNSLKDKSNPLSGNENLIPEYTTFSKLYNQMYKFEEEYEGNKNMMAPDDRRDILKAHEKAYNELKGEFNKVVDAYNEFVLQKSIVENNAIQQVQKIIADRSRNSFSRYDIGQKAFYILNERKDAEPLDRLSGKHLQQELAIRRVLEYTKKNHAFPTEVKVVEGKEASKLGLDVFNKVEDYRNELEKLDMVIDGKTYNTRRSDTEKLAAEMQPTPKTTYYVYPSNFEQQSGRWNTPQHKEINAYQKYGQLLSTTMMLSDRDSFLEPRDIEGKEFSRLNSFLLQLEAKDKGYSSPIYVSLSHALDNGIRVKEDAKPFPIITEKGVEMMFNLSKTDFPVNHPDRSAEMEHEAFINEKNRERAGSSYNIFNLIQNSLFSTKTEVHDENTVNRYDAKDNTIHIGHLVQEDYARLLIMSTRKEESKLKAFDATVKEDVVANIGAGILGQQLKFDVNQPDSSRYWTERLKSDPGYAKEVIKAAEQSSDKIISYISEIKDIQNQNQNIDLRSLTPVDIDTDENGIVDSAENLEADKKQGASEDKPENETVKHQTHVHKGR